MNILLINYEYKPQCGGAGFATYNLAKELNRQGHHVDLMIGWDDHFGQPELLDGSKTYVVKLRKKSVHESSPLGVLGFIIKGMPLIAKITKRNSYDVIQFFFSVPTGLLKYGIKNKIPYVCSLRGIDVPSARKDKYAFLRKILNLVNRDIVKNSSAVLALSNELAGWFHNAYTDIPVEVIPNGLDCTLFSRKEQYSEKIKKFVTVTRLIECKNIELSMRAFKKVHEMHPDITLDIIGEGYLRKSLEKVIREEEMTEYICLKGYMEPTEIAAKLKEYDLFYLLTIADSFGQVFIEAMACGLPIICADIGGPKEIVVNGVTGLSVVPNDEESTVKALEYAIRHPKVMKEYGENGYQRVVNEYSIESVARKHIEVYSRVIKGKPGLWG
jgi:glycosyltransferase involved in cell wall biosynthesis